MHLQAEEEDPEEASPSGAAWCFTAVMAFMAMLLIRHMFEMFDTGREVRPVPHDHDHSHDGGLGPEASAGMLLLWLTVRFLVILIPMYAVLRVMHTVRDQHMQDEADQDLDQELAALLRVSALCHGCLSGFAVCLMNAHVPAVTSTTCDACTGWDCLPGDRSCLCNSFKKLGTWRGLTACCAAAFDRQTCCLHLSTDKSSSSICTVNVRSGAHVFACQSFPWPYCHHNKLSLLCFLLILPWCCCLGYAEHGSWAWANPCVCQSSRESSCKSCRKSSSQNTGPGNASPAHSLGS